MKKTPQIKRLIMILDIEYLKLEEAERRIKKLEKDLKDLTE